MSVWLRKTWLRNAWLDAYWLGREADDGLPAAPFIAARRTARKQRPAGASLPAVDYAVARGKIDGVSRPADDLTATR